MPPLHSRTKEEERVKIEKGKTETERGKFKVANGLQSGATSLRPITIPVLSSPSRSRSLPDVIMSAILLSASSSDPQPVLPFRRGRRVNEAEGGQLGGRHGRHKLYLSNFYLGHIFGVCPLAPVTHASLTLCHCLKAETGCGTEELADGEIADIMTLRSD